jgi:hypothetical protein
MPGAPSGFIDGARLVSREAHGSVRAASRQRGKPTHGPSLSPLTRTLAAATEPGVAVATKATSAEEGQMARADPGRCGLGPDPLKVVWGESAVALAGFVVQVEARIRDSLARMRLPLEGKRPS